VYWWNEFKMKNNKLGKIYGHQIRNYNNEIDQIKYCIKEINNNSRRAVITLWNPSDLKDQALPCCYTQFNFVRIENKLNMIINFRSSDLFLGLPYDVIVGALFLIKIAGKTNLIANRLAMNLADAHIYETHIPQVDKYINSIIYGLPVFKKNKLINYKHNKYLKTKLIL
jgi:thymidylate synthase